MLNNLPENQLRSPLHLHEIILKQMGGGGGGGGRYTLPHPQVAMALFKLFALKLTTICRSVTLSDPTTISQSKYIQRSDFRLI